MNSPSAVELTVVLPCLNEAETLATCIRKARSSFADLGVVGEVVVADNGSTDGSQAIAVDEGARVVDVVDKGYGAAVLGGVEAARGRFVIMADADDSYDLSHLGPFLERLRAGDDLVMGNRFAGGIEPGAMPALHRYVGNPLLSLLGRSFFRSPCRDFHCGMRGFRRDAILGLDLRTTGMEFATEMVVRSTLADLRIEEVPTTLRPDGRSRAPHLQTWRDGWRHLRFLLLYSPTWFFLMPGLLMLVLGLGSMVALLVGPIDAFGSTFDDAALVYSMAVALVGYQPVLFSVFSRAFAINEGLLPVTRGARRAFGLLTLERGIAIGVLLFVAGLVLAVVGIVTLDSGSNPFDDSSDAVRVVVPAATLLVLGIETIMSSFFLSVLGLARR